MIAVVVLLCVMGGELTSTALRISQTFDEGCHILAGYLSWKHFDFGINPEHPPLAKLVAALPLLSLNLRVPASHSVFFKPFEFSDGRDFLYSNDANVILFRARIAAALFTLALAVCVFFAARSMWGVHAALIALVLIAFDPNIIAHGALITTDMGVTLGIFLGVYAFYEYVKRPTPARLLAAGLAAGVALATKHSGVLLFPILAFLALLELHRDSSDGKEGIR